MEPSILRRAFTCAIVVMLIAISLIYNRGDSLAIQFKQIVDKQGMKYFETKVINIDRKPGMNFKEISKEHLTTLNRTINIVLYYPFHGMLKRKAREFNPRKCVYKNCQVRIHEEKGTNPIANASAVIFQGGRMPGKLPKRNHTDQVFILQNYETPQYLQFTNLRRPIFTDFFNWTMTYRLDSDIPFTYGTVIPKTIRTEAYKKLLELVDHVPTWKWLEIEHNELSRDHKYGVFNKRKDYIGDARKKNYTSVFRAKTRNVAWMVSHCNTASKREEYANMMSKHIDIDIYGACRKLKCPKQDAPICKKMIEKKYKFYLSFENSMCTDYITEKAYNWFKADIVPVMRGDNNYSKHFPKGTFVDANDFDSPMALAKYLKRLGSNESEYTRMLEIRDRYTLITEEERCQIGYCQLCRMLNNIAKYRKSIHSIADWWHDKQVCTNNFYW